jgi:hypothetical protein
MSFYVVKEHILSLFKYTEAYLVLQKMILGKCSMCTCEECVFCSLGVECPIIVHQVQLIHVTAQIFC